MDPEEWVPRLISGEDHAWKEFIRVYSRFVPMVSSGLGLSAVEREEVLQDMVLTAYRSIGNLRNHAQLASWVYTITRRTAINHWKSKRQLPGTGADEGLLLERIPADDAPIDLIMSDWDEGTRLREAVAGLKPGCRSLVEDLFLAEPRLSYKEVSEKRGMPVGSIGPTLARCLETLRRAWKAVSKPR